MGLFLVSSSSSTSVLSGSVDFGDCTIVVLSVKVHFGCCTVLEFLDNSTTGEGASSAGFSGGIYKKV